ncbi:hypothetical protein MKQ70_19865 [Chitinophaga sedimenti]|uniref:hypothetical protein n=1 Tax=Chitinophaga sedimenti TaxID=2033606 RepID=UPI002005AB68|nr:hypothetical protein [Chitinophaga sedimenti]MCK7557138.1 hypothetical protein [Chitinophaga sedimenti]
MCRIDRLPQLQHAAGLCKNIGFWGFGASAHILAQLAKHEGRHVYAFTKDGDTTTQAFALQKGAVWAGNAGTPSPCRLDASIIFAADGRLVPKALAAADKGGCVICAGIHMSDIPAFPYELLWQERSIRSVANLTREDGERFLQLAPAVPVTTTITTFPLEEANKAIETLRNGSIKGAVVLTMP